MEILASLLDDYDEAEFFNDEDEFNSNFETSVTPPTLTEGCETGNTSSKQLPDEQEQQSEQDESFDEMKGKLQANIVVRARIFCKKLLKLLQELLPKRKNEMIIFKDNCLFYCDHESLVTCINYN